MAVTSAQPAQAAPVDICDQTLAIQSPTIQSLRACVQQMTAEGLIDSQGAANSLLTKLDAAQAAVSRGQPDGAGDLLAAFVREVRAPAAKHIAQPHADHLILHAEMVIQALESSDTA